MARRKTVPPADTPNLLTNALPTTVNSIFIDLAPFYRRSAPPPAQEQVILTRVPLEKNPIRVLAVLASARCPLSVGQICNALSCEPLISTLPGAKSDKPIRDAVNVLIGLKLANRNPETKNSPAEITDLGRQQARLHHLA